LFYHIYRKQKRYEHSLSYIVFKQISEFENINDMTKEHVSICHHITFLAHLTQRVM
jgi:hypothetical protein